MDNLLFLSDFRQRAADKDKARQEDALIDQKVELLKEHMYGKNPLEGQEERLAKIHAIDRQLEALG